MVPRKVSKFTNYVEERRTLDSSKKYVSKIGLNYTLKRGRLIYLKFGSEEGQTVF